MSFQTPRYPTGLTKACYGTDDLFGQVFGRTTVRAANVAATVSLPVGGAVTGRVTNSAGGSVGNVSLTLNSDRYGLGSSGPSTGTAFRLDSLPPGRYSLCFRPYVVPEETGIVYGATCYGTTAGDPTPTITVTAGVTTRLDRVVLCRGSTLSGHLWHESAITIRHDEVQVFRDGRMVGRNYPAEDGG